MHIIQLITLTALVIMPYPAYASDMRAGIILFTIPIAILSLFISLLIADKSVTKKSLIAIILLNLPNLALSLLTIALALDHQNLEDVILLIAIGVAGLFSFYYPSKRLISRLSIPKKN